MKAMGLNTIRVSFAPYCTSPSGDGHSDSPYSLTDAQNTIKVANYYGFWIVLRYDGDDDIATQTTCWLNYWQTVIQQVGPLYTQIVWEPINEPPASVSILSANYQLWINMARNIGDQHFIAVENQCSRSCPYSADVSQGYPIVSDSLGKVLISYHKYYSYLWNTWTVSAAVSTAQSDYQATLKGEQVTGWYALDTEGGPSMGATSCNGSSGTTSGCPPDTYLPGSAGYTNVSFAYIQTITNLFDSHSPRINWIWWPIGTWIDTECSGSFGALQPVRCPGGTGYRGGVGWGNLLQYVPVNGISRPPVLSTGFTFLPTGPLVNSPVSFTAITTGGALPYTTTWNFGDGVTGNGETTTHTYTTAQSFTVSETSTDSSTPSQTATSSKSVNVFTSLPPALTVPGNQTVTAGTWINFTVTAGAVNTGGTVILSITGLPTGAAFDPTTGRFSWKPSASQIGSYTVVFIATDTGSPSTPISKPMGIQVDQAAPGGSNGGSGGGSNGSCFYCGIFPTVSNSIVLLVIGGLLGLITSLALLTIRARASLERTKRKITG
jgi:hypothetical protein